MATTSKSESRTKKELHVSKDISFCSDCEYTWCNLRTKIVYCSLKYKGISAYNCESNNCKTNFN